MPAGDGEMFTSGRTNPYGSFVGFFAARMRQFRLYA
jgi:hypothetical protein